MPHINEKIDFTVGAFIVYQSKVLLIFHKALKKWLPIGGHIELDEDPEEGLLREIKEECGLDVEVVADKPDITSAGTKFLPTPSYMDIHEISDTHRHVGMIYFARAKDDKVVLAKDEHDDIRWFNRGDLDMKEFNLSGAIQFYCKQALERITDG